MLMTVTSGVMATTRYVKVTASGNGDGSSWLNASGNLQGIINASVSGDEVWVAFGSYQPVNRGSFIMKEGVKIYGGFKATENTLAERES